MRRLVSYVLGTSPTDEFRLEEWRRLHDEQQQQDTHVCNQDCYAYARRLVREVLHSGTSIIISAYDVDREMQDCIRDRVLRILRDDLDLTRVTDITFETCGRGNLQVNVVVKPL